jgi:hypothetical protein
VLIASEALEAWAIQRRIFALKHRRMLVAATSGRLISIRPRLIAGFELDDMRWQDLEEVTLSVGVFGADLMVRAGRATDLAIEGASGVRRLQFEGLRKEQAQAVYRVCQAQDQAWREKRRIRELDELRMRSGAVQVMSAAALGAGGAAAPGSETDARCQAHHRFRVRGDQGKDRFARLTNTIYALDLISNGCDARRVDRLFIRRDQPRTSPS